MTKNKNNKGKKIITTTNNNSGASCGIRITLMWRVSLLVIICHATSVADATSWTCSLAPARLIVRPRSIEGGLRRRTPAGNDAILLPGGYIEHRTQDEKDAFDFNTTSPYASSNLFDPTDGVTTNVSNLSGADIGDNGDSGEPTVYMDVRLCTCARSLLQVADDFYCPSPASYCSVWKSRYDEYYGVKCIEYKNMAVAWSRHSWYYIIFLFVLMFIFLFCSRPGHHAIKYPISRCLPMMNRWITEKLLQAEMQSRNRIRAEYEQAVRLARRTEGWISGYSIKTKLHSRNDTTTKNLTTEVELPRDYCESNIMYDSMCTICLLEVDDGDRVADLSCGHVFHPDCLGEWILKKNSCPLCQNRNIANEIRTFEANEDGNNHDSRTERILSRWRREAYDKFVDIVTGTSRRGHRTLTNQ